MELDFSEECFHHDASVWAHALVENVEVVLNFREGQDVGDTFRGVSHWIGVARQVAYDCCCAD